MRYIGDGSCRDAEWYRGFARKQQELAARTGLCLFSLVVGSRVAGFVGIQPWDQRWGPTEALEIGWRLGTEFWGNGYVTRAAREVLRMASRRCVTEVVSMIQEGNKRSISVAGRLGMTAGEAYISPLGQKVRQFTLALNG